MFHPFTEISEGQVILLQKGTFKQVPLYRRDWNLFAKMGSGYIKLYKAGSTSVPTICWKEIDPGEFALSSDAFSMICETQSTTKARIAAE